MFNVKVEMECVESYTTYMNWKNAKTILKHTNKDAQRIHKRMNYFGRIINQTQSQNTIYIVWC